MVLFREFNPTDSDETILNKLALALKDLPENIIIISRRPGEIEAVSLRDQIKQLARQRKYSSLEPLMDRLVELNPALKQDNIVYEYVLYKRPTYGPDGEGFFRLAEEPQLSQVNYNLDNVLTRLSSYESNRQRALDRLAKQAVVVEEKVSELQRLPALKYTQFQVETTTWFIQAVYNDYQSFPSDLYALDLFNACATSEKLPFIQLNYKDEKYYKMHNPLPEFKMDFDDYPMVAVIRENSNWHYIYFEFSVGSNSFKIIFNSLAQKSQETVLDTLWNHFPAIKKSGQREQNVRGDFMVENINVNYLALADIIFNNPLYTQYLYMDESSSVVSKKTRINIHYQVSPIQKILFMLNNEGDNIRVRISKAPTKRSVEDFAVILSKLLSEYKNLEPIIIQLYADYNIDITEKEKKLIKKGKKVARQLKKIDLLKEAAPDLFLKQYARKCQGEQQPTIVDNPESYEDQGYQVVEFPQQPNRNNKYYICESKQYPYPGLQQNTLPNKDIYPYIPCCFETKQLDTSIPNYIQQYIQSKTSAKPRDTSHIITVLKVIDTANRIGNLPKFVGDWLEALLGEECQRRGVEQGPLNFIHAVLSAVDTQYQNLETSQEREQYVNNYLGALLRSNIYVEACKQSNYELSVDQLRELWLDPTRYHDVLRFMRLLELKHKIKIIVISPDKILTPRFMDFYARTPINLDRDKIVLLFNHYGSETSDALIDAHNELIITKSGSTFYEREQAAKLYDVYIEAIQFYETSLTQPLRFEMVETPRIFLRKELAPIKQYIDGYGKCQLVVFKYNDREYTLQIPPSMPYNMASIKLSSIPSYGRATLEEVSEIIQSLDGEAIAKSVSTHGIWFRARLMDTPGTPTGVFFIAIQPQETINLPVRDSLTLWDTIIKGHRLEQLRSTRRKANILTSILFFLLRLNNKKLPLSDEKIGEFISEFITVDDGHRYDIPIRRLLPPLGINPDTVIGLLNHDFPSYVSDGKLVLDSGVALERVKQLLKSDVGIPRQDSLMKNIFLIAEFMIGMARPADERSITRFIEDSTVMMNGYKYEEISLKKIPSTMDELVGVVPKFFDATKKLIIGFPELRSILIDFLSSDVPIGEFYAINNYFAYNYDFEIRPNEKVFIGEQQFTDYIGMYQNFGNVYISNETRPGNPFPYFMKFPSGVGLVQNTEYGTKEAALGVLKYWKEHSYNPGFKGGDDQSDTGKIIEYTIQDGQWITRTEGVGDEYTLLKSGDYFSAVIMGV